MAYEKKEGTGALFKNDKKTTDNHPDYKGDLKINGVDCWIAAWLKTSEKTGKKYMSLSVAAKDADQDSKAPSRKEPNEDSDVPF